MCFVCILNYAFSKQLSVLTAVTNYLRQAAVSRDVPNIRFEFASVQNSAPNSVFVFGQIVSSERIRIVSLYMYNAASDVYMVDFTQSVPAALAQTA